MSESTVPYLVHPDGKTKFHINHQPILIGRNPAHTCYFTDDSISRDHAEVRRSGDRIVLEDRGSRNGTLLNGRRIDQPVELRDGDVINICNERLVFRNPLDDDSSVWTDDSSGLSNIRIADDDQSKFSSVQSKIEVGRNRLVGRGSTHRKLNALIDISRALNTALQLNEILAHMLDCLFKLFKQADRGFVILLNEKGEPIPCAMKLRLQDYDEETLVISRSVFDAVIKAKTAMVSRDASTDERFREGDSLQSLNIKSIMCAPIMNSANEPIGVLQLDSLNSPRSFRHDDLELLVAAAIQGGLAIENSRLITERVEAARFKQELRMATEVQLSQLPKSRPSQPGYEFYDYYKPAHQVGGDYFDYVPLESGKLAIVVADVVGHGVPAAMLMSRLAAETRMALKMADRLSEVVEHINESIMRVEGDFATMVIAVLDPVKRSLEIVNAGHCQPLIRRADGSIDQPSQELGCLALGFKANAEFSTFPVQLNPGDVVLTFTDGLWENTNESDEAYQLDRIHSVLSSCQHDAAAMIAGELVRDFNNFTASTDPFDDICLVAFGCKPLRVSSAVTI